jgi:serine/threonine protein kinase
MALAFLKREREGGPARAVRFPAFSRSVRGDDPSGETIRQGKGDDKMSEINSRTDKDVRMIDKDVRMIEKDARMTKKDIWFCKTALAQGRLSKEDIRECIKIVDVRRSDGILSGVGEVAVEKGYLDAREFEAIAAAIGNPAGEVKLPGYRLEQKIGRGSKGIVFRATQLSLDKTVAIKILNPKLARNKVWVERLEREARIAARLNHPNIVEAYDLGRALGLYYIVMEYVDGESLQEMLDRGIGFSEEEVVELALQITEALCYLNRKGVVHRDIKPGNILITGDGTAKLSDLSLARTISLETSVEQNGNGRIGGTPAFMSPERARGENDVDVRSDIYSLGITLYTMIVGVPPFRGKVEDVLRHHRKSKIPELRWGNRTFSPGLKRLLKKMTAKDPDSRFVDPVALMEALESLKSRRSRTFPLTVAAIPLTIGVRPSGEKNSDRASEYAAFHGPQGGPRSPRGSHANLKGCRNGPQERHRDLCDNPSRPNSRDRGLHGGRSSPLPAGLALGLCGGG